MARTVLLGVMLVLCVARASGQSQNSPPKQSDSTFVAAAASKATSFYTQSVGPNSHLYNGSEYKDYISQNEETPMLYDDAMDGDVLYTGEVYTYIPLYYDLEKDVVLTSYPMGNKIQLISDRVGYFDIDGHRYVRIAGKKISDGFYDQLHNGELKFYARRSKQHNFRTSGTQVTHEYELRVKYFIEKNGVFHVVKSKRSVLNLMPLQKRELKKTIREENLSFKKERERTIVRLLQRFEELNGK